MLILNCVCTQSLQQFRKIIISDSHLKILSFQCEYAFDESYFEVIGLKVIDKVWKNKTKKENIATVFEVGTWQW